jgi:hypothetical protein
MGSRSAYAWPVGTAVVVLVMSAWFFVTDVENRPYTLFGPLLVGVFVFLVIRHKQWLEVTPDDTVLVQRRALKTVRVRLEDARQLYLRSNGGGTAQLVARSADGRTAFAAVLMISMYAEGYQQADVLQALITGAERNRSKNAREVVEVLQRQLEHVRAGGPVKAAPLAAFATDVTGIIGAAGAAGAAGGLSDV